jgi:hypothetical protein
MFPTHKNERQNIETGTQKNTGSLKNELNISKDQKQM